MTMVFTLNQWDAESRAFTVMNTPPTEAPTMTTTTDNSIFGSATTVPAGSLCLVSVIYAVACCSDDIPVC